MTTNSTTMIKCFNEEACIGGYQPENEFPVSCKVGYEGYLCSVCGIVDNEKYEEVSDYLCSKCPNPTLNTIKVVGMLILAVAFMVAIIIVNIRKKNENQMSILLRILTNYLQFITITLSMEVNISQTLDKIFQFNSNFSSSNAAFLSFD